MRHISTLEYALAAVVVLAVVGTAAAPVLHAIGTAFAHLAAALPQ
jgi:Flp pilus assembly pilin Flp